MIIEVIGIGAPNKGAELMLTSIKQQILNKFPNAKFVVEPYTDYLDRCPHNVYQKFWFSFKGIQLGFLGALIPQKIRSKFGIILDSEIDYILDASGFAYGDQWGAKKLENRLTKHIVKWKKNGKKVILMPQAFGPFEKKEFNTILPKLVENADLIFARDSDSLKFLQISVGDNTNTIYQAPDYTNLCKGITPPELIVKELDVCFIPNSKMIDMTSSNVGNSYSKFFANLIEVTIKNNRKPFLLVHEGEKDLKLAQEINSLLAEPIEVLKYNDPLHIKGVIGKSKVVISSRFHGLVSSLSQEIPCIATGWSHKYQMLMSDYGCEDLLVDQSSDLAVTKLCSLFEASTYNSVKEKIKINSTIEKEKSKLFWNKVFDVIK